MLLQSPCDGGSQTDVGTTDSLMICQKQHRQNDLAGKVYAPTGEEVHVTGDF